MAVTSAEIGPEQMICDFSNHFFEVPARLLDERRVGCYTVKNAPGGNFSNFIDVGCVQEELHDGCSTKRFYELSPAEQNGWKSLACNGPFGSLADVGCRNLHDVKHFIGLP